MSERVLNLSEKAFLAQVRELARWCGWRTYHTHDNGRSEAGFPDLVLARSGTLGSFYLPRSRPTPAA